MRSLLTLICGGPGRAAIFALGIVATGFLIDGRGDALLRAVFVTVTFGGAFLLAFLSLLFLAAACGLDVEAAVGASRCQSSRSGVEPHETGPESVRPLAEDDHG